MGLRVRRAGEDEGWEGKEGEGLRLGRVWKWEWRRGGELGMEYGWGGGVLLVWG